MHKTYLLGIEGVAALRGVDVSVFEGDFVCIFGTSGGGKTTLLNMYLDNIIFILIYFDLLAKLSIYFFER